jgi:DNA-binding transcriptional LysR family regulator
MDRPDLRHLDLNLLVVLDRLLDLASVTEAAKALGLSQPAASRSLARLRETLGDPLLVRAGRDLVLTERARELRAPLADALTATRRVFAAPADFDPTTADGDLVLALGDEVQHALGGVIARALWERAPGINLRIRRLSADTIEEGRRGLVDLAVAPDLSPLPKSAGAVDLSDLVVRPLYLRRFQVASAADRTCLDLPGFLSARHVIVSFEAGGRGFVDDILRPLGYTRRVAASVTTFPAALALIAETDLLGTVPHEVAVRWPGITLHTPPFALPDLPIGLMWHPRQTSDPRHRFLREVVGSAVRDAVTRVP